MRPVRKEGRGRSHHESSSEGRIHGDRSPLDVAVRGEGMSIMLQDPLGDWAGRGATPPGQRRQGSVQRKGLHAHHKQRHEFPAHRLQTPAHLCEYSELGNLMPSSVTSGLNGC